MFHWTEHYCITPSSHADRRMPTTYGGMILNKSTISKINLKTNDNGVGSGVGKGDSMPQIPTGHTGQFLVLGLKLLPSNKHLLFGELLDDTYFSCLLEAFSSEN